MSKLLNKFTKHIWNVLQYQYDKTLLLFIIITSRQNLMTFTGEGNGNPLQYSFLGNPRNRGACWATVHRGHWESSKDRATKSTNTRTVFSEGIQTNLTLSYQPRSFTRKVLQHNVLPCNTVFLGYKKLLFAFCQSLSKHLYHHKSHITKTFNMHKI